MLCFTVFLAMGDNPTMAAQQANASQNASVSVADVIGISVPSLVNASNTGIGSQTALELKYGANTNNVTSTSNGKIDVYIKSVAQIMNNNTTAYPTDNLTFYFTNDTGAHNQFNGAWQKAIDQWKIPTGTPISGANKLVKLDVDV
ncbi:MAG: hypothetical protein ACXVHS_10760, partial [Methanobacterium sp.]